MFNQLNNLGEACMLTSIKKDNEIVNENAIP